MAPPSTCAALVQRNGKPVKDTIAVPTPQEHQVLVKLAYVAQNPTDGMLLPHILGTRNY